MKPWIKRSLIALAGVGIVVGTLSACGHRGERHGGWSEERITEMRGKAVERIGSRLDLSGEQKLKLDRLAGELLAARQAVQGQGSPVRDEFKALIASERFDRSRAEQWLAQKTQAVQGSSPQVITAMADFYDSLNPAQQAQVRQYLDKWGGRRKG